MSEYGLDEEWQAKFLRGLQTGYGSSTDGDLNADLTPAEQADMFAEMKGLSEGHHYDGPVSDVWVGREPQQPPVE